MLTHQGRSLEFWGGTQNINCLWLNNHWPKASARRRRRRSGVVWRRGRPLQIFLKIGSLRCSLVLSKRQIYCDKYCPVMPNLWKVIQSAIQSTICQNTFILGIGYIINIYWSCLTVIQLHIKSGIEIEINRPKYDILIFFKYIKSQVVRSCVPAYIEATPLLILHCKIMANYGNP